MVLVANILKPHIRPHRQFVEHIRPHLAHQPLIGTNSSPELESMSGNCGEDDEGSIKNLPALHPFPGTVLQKTAEEGCLPNFRLSQIHVAKHSGRYPTQTPPDALRGFKVPSPSAEGKTDLNRLEAKAAFMQRQLGLVGSAVQMTDRLRYWRKGGNASGGAGDKGAAGGVGDKN
ncbi:unnamed protein product [Tuber aestivum]|uniref:Uncharacterized protein n=1 Tax=Tuber aestivum TaxID=59557 RepID=A0A292QA04_9PEZI|nr:unnamed protein product [Tuber aestivum]